MYGKAAGMAAFSTGEPVKWETIYDRIIKILRKSIVICDRNRYHNIIGGMNALAVIHWVR